VARISSVSFPVATIVQSTAFREAPSEDFIPGGFIGVHVRRQTVSRITSRIRFLGRHRFAKFVVRQGFDYPQYEREQTRSNDLRTRFREVSRIKLRLSRDHGVYRNNKSAIHRLRCRTTHTNNRKTKTLTRSGHF
jgi:hypothetical protein